MNLRCFPTRPKTLACALLAAGIALSDTALAAEAPPSAHELLHQWARVVVYAVTPFCQVLSNGLRVCQPIGLVGPATDSPAAAYQPLVRVPLAPPSILPPGIPTLAYPPYGANPYLPAMPFLPWQALPGTPMAAAPTAGTQATAELPSIVPPPAQPAPQAAATPGPIASEPPAQQPAATPAANVPAETVPSAPTVTASSPAADPAADTATAQMAVVLFEFDRAELTEAGRAALDAWLASNPRGTRVVVTGHADRLGPAHYNLDLSRRRAEAARDHLVKRGMDPRLITIVAKGETLPVVYCKGGPSPVTIDCLSPNRRAVVDPLPARR